MLDKLNDMYRTLDELRNDLKEKLNIPKTWVKKVNEEVRIINGNGEEIFPFPVAEKSNGRYEITGVFEFGANLYGKDFLIRKKNHY